MRRLSLANMVDRFFLSDPDKPEQEKKKPNMKDALSSAYSEEEAGNRLAVFGFGKDDIGKGLNLLKDTPVKFLPLEYNNTNMGGVYVGSDKYKPENYPELPGKTIYLNKSDRFKKGLLSIFGEEGTHVIDAGMRTLSQNGNLKKTIAEKDRILKGITGLQDKVNLFVNPDKLKTLQERIGKGEINEGYDKYITDEKEFRGRLNSLRAERLANTGIKWWDNWNSLEGLNTGSEALEQLRSITDDENIIKALNELAGNSGEEKTTIRNRVPVQSINFA